MPLWRIFHPENFFTAAEKANLSRNLTSMYTHILPAFYVEVVFVPLPPGSIFVGGEERTNYIRLAGEHIARNLNDDKQKMRSMMERVTAAVGPLMTAKDAEWEAHIDETKYDLWRINGIQPPLPGSEAETLWKKENRAVAYL